MPEAEDARQQIDLLNINRRSLKMLLKQAAMAGAGGVSEGIQNNILWRRNQIAESKNILRGFGYTIDDYPEDIESSVEKMLLPVGTKVKIEIDNQNTILVMPNEVYVMMRRKMQEDYQFDISKYVIDSM